MSSPLRRTILFAEDDLMVRNLYSMVLENAGFDVQVVQDGKALLKSFEQTKPDAVLVDLMIPELNGVQAIQSLRTLAGGQEVPIIAVTSSFVPELIGAAKEAGANTILSKMELNPAQLIYTLKLFLLSNPSSTAA